MIMIPVTNSSNISAIGYDPNIGDVGTLKVRFIHGKEYTFKDVPVDIWENFKTAESKGSFFAKYIKGKFNG